MEILTPEAESFLGSFLPKPCEVQLKMERYAKEVNFPLVDVFVGNFLSQLVSLTQAKTIFEIGSGFGYSAFWFAKNLAENGKIFCTDFNEAYKKMALEFFQEAKITKNIEFLVGDGIEFLKNQSKDFDLIFLDCDKYLYPKAFPVVLEKLKISGLLVTDNFVNAGKRKNADKRSAGLETYQNLLLNCKQFQTTVLPFRDGLALSYKIF